MHSSVLLLGVYCGLSTAANPHPWMYGVPDYPDLDINEIITQADVNDLVATAEDISTALTTAESTNATSPSTTAGQEPCAVISSAIAALPSGARPIVPAELGVRCLQSVPIDRDGDMRLIDDMKLLVKWQSNLAYLKNPPPEYNEKPVDIMGELDNMKSQLSSGGFATEYDFQMQMMRLFDSAYDSKFICTKRM
jgi:hypothetical protein